MAKTGYGKRPAGDEPPHADADFAHLGPREAELAEFIDALPTGAAMGHKALAAEHPRYGQQAVRTSMGRLTDAGHLRWVKEHLTVEDNSMRWVTRTYWSRERRSAEWWAEFVRARHGRDVTHDYRPGLARVTPLEPERAPERAAPDPGPAHHVLAQLRNADRRLALSDAECRALAPQAAEWLARGATPTDLTQALTAGLPDTVSNPGGFARKRLEIKMPPKRTRADSAPLRAVVTRAVEMCPLCEEDERTVRIVNGICEECREEMASDGDA
ncbi:hypothetical protein [Streptomyces lasiicapitis]|uniref:hypothetical protein n=1 Tax=Streptomyces lasiicapitis TaxID=1923961 RepID=UPI0036621853